MAETSAGLLMCRVLNADVQFFLVHPGGPFYKNKDKGVWSIPKGLVNENENLLSAAMREFSEETGIKPAGKFHPLDTVKLKSGKVVHAWAFLGDWDPATGIVSNTFALQWPPRSNKIIDVPEADRAMWFFLDEAITHIHPAQQEFLRRAYEIFRKDHR